MAKRRVPDAVKVLTGTDQPCRMHPEPDYPKAKELVAPDWLESPEAVEEWNRLTPMMTGARTISEGDLTILGHMCNLHGVCVAMWRESRSMPTAAMLTQLRMMYAEFGLTPASRSKAAQLESDAKENPFAQLKGGPTLHKPKGKDG